jgi:hypothetical protein
VTQLEASSQQFLTVVRHSIYKLQLWSVNTVTAEEPKYALNARTAKIRLGKFFQFFAYLAWRFDNQLAPVFLKLRMDRSTAFPKACSGVAVTPQHSDLAQKNAFSLFDHTKPLREFVPISRDPLLTTLPHTVVNEYLRYIELRFFWPYST